MPFDAPPHHGPLMLHPNYYICRRHSSSLCLRPSPCDRGERARPAPFMRRPARAPAPRAAGGPPYPGRRSRIARPPAPPPSPFFSLVTRFLTDTGWYVPLCLPRPSPFPPLPPASCPLAFRRPPSRAPGPPLCRHHHPAPPPEPLCVRVPLHLPPSSHPLMPPPSVVKPLRREKSKSKRKTPRLYPLAHHPPPRPLFARVRNPPCLIASAACRRIKVRQSSLERARPACGAPLWPLPPSPPPCLCSFGAALSLSSRRPRPNAADGSKGSAALLLARAQTCKTHLRRSLCSIGRSALPRGSWWQRARPAHVRHPTCVPLRGALCARARRASTKKERARYSYARLLICAADCSGPIAIANIHLGHTHQLSSSKEAHTDDSERSSRCA